MLSFIYSYSLRVSWILRLGIFKEFLGIQMQPKEMEKEDVRGLVTSHVDLSLSPASYPVCAVNAKIPKALPMAAFHLISWHMCMALMMFYGRSSPVIGITTSHERNKGI